MKLRPYSFPALFFITATIYGQAAPAAAPAAPAAQSAPATTAAAPATAQPAAPHPTFDVATIKPSAPLDYQKLAADFQAGKMPRLGPHVDASRAEYLFMTLKQLIVVAYKVKPYQVDGPPWLGDTHFDVEAKMPDGSSKDDAPAMLQALLVDRFKLSVHRTQEEHKVLALVVGKAGPKMKESPAAPADIDPNAPLQPGEAKMDTDEGEMRILRKSDGSIVMNMGKRGTITEKMDMATQSLHLESSTVTMDGFADMLTNLTQMTGGGGTQIVNMTGLKGNYQIALDLSLADLMSIARAQGGDVPGAAGGSSAPVTAPANAASDPQGGQAVFSSVEQMGLKLEERKATVERLVVDHVEKTPTED